MMNERNTVLYTGVTNNLVRRVYEHKNKIGSKRAFANRYNTTKLVFYEVTENVYSAIRREKQIKGWTRKKKLDLVSQLNSELLDLYEKIM